MFSIDVYTLYDEEYLVRNAGWQLEQNSGTENKLSEMVIKIRETLQNSCCRVAQQAR